MSDVILNDGIAIGSGLDYYGSLSGGNTYFEMNREVWDDASDADKIAALTEATRAIDKLNYKGTKNGTLEFPRGDDTEVPTPIEHAAYELALRLLDGIDLDLENESLGITEDRFVSVVSKRNPDYIPEHIKAGIPSLKAWYLLKPYLRGSGHVRMKRIN